MKFKEPKNNNYVATIVEIKNLRPLFTIKGEECRTIQGTTIFGNSVIIGKDTEIGAVGLFFPVETKLSPDYLRANNLYRKSELNWDTEKAGFFEENGRIKAVRLQGNPSNGLFMPLTSIGNIFDMKGVAHPKKTDMLFNIGDVFDEFMDIPICEKYVVIRREKGQRTKNMGKVKRISKLVDNQFRLHYDTSHLGRNMHLLNPESLVSITKKVHGTSVIISKILINKKLSWYQKLLKFLGADVKTEEYGNIYASRRVVKNEFALGEKDHVHFYKEDIWKIANDEIQEFLLNGMTVYAEVVGHLSNGAYIQKPFDYGCAGDEHKIYIYRITYTNVDGQVFEFSARQVQNWCKMNGLNPVIELYYGTLRNVFPELEPSDHWRETFLEKLREKYLEQDCTICKNIVPDEGIVVRDENTNEAFKFKSFKFLEFESKHLDKGEVDIEEDGDEDNE